MLLYVLAIIAASSVYACDPLNRADISVFASSSEDYLLPNNAIPLLYQIELEPNFETDTFSGRSNITFTAIASGNSITFHTLDLDIAVSGLSLLDENGDVVNSISEISYTNDDRQFYTITFEEELQAGSRYTLVIGSYTGVLNNDNNGFYLARYTNEEGIERKLAATDFVATFARRAFPCFDEPGLKAEFEISVIRTAEYNSNTNMPLVFTEALENNLYRDVYARTPRMSTYLVVVVVSDFSYVANENHRVFGRPEVISAGQADYTLNVSVSILDIVADYVGVPYTLPKMDQIGIPNNYFRWTAMENWGLVTYRENALMFATPQAIVELVSHEFGHQWFGNLVTPSWWSHVWLSEGFATYIEYYAASIQQDYDFVTRIVTAITQSVLALDSSTTTRPMNEDAGSPEDLIDLFDRIAYYKGASVIRMAEGIMSSEVFRRGVNIYLNRMQFGNAQPSDLYASWQEALTQANLNFLPEGEDMESVMTTWDSNPGYPLLTVTRNYTDGSVSFSQRRFLTSDPNNDDETIWYIPISYATQTNPDFSEPTPRVWLTTRTISSDLNDLRADDWIIVNIQQSGYYRINYDEENWYRIIDFLASDNADQIHSVNRAQMIDDAFELARYGVIDYDIPLGLSQYLIKEANYAPLQSFVNALSYLDSQLVGTDVYQKFQAHVLKVLDTAFKSMELKENEHENVITKLNKQNIVTWICSYGNKNCEDYALQILKEWRESGQISLSPYLQVPLICTALKIGDDSDWEFVFQRYLVEKNPILRENLSSSLACTENKNLVLRYLNTILNAEDITASEHLSALSSTYKSGNQGITYLQDYIKQNWSTLKEKLSSTQLSSLVTDVMSKLSTKNQLSEIEHLVAKDAKEINIRKGVDGLKMNIIWNEERLPSIRSWLYKRY